MIQEYLAIFRRNLPYVIRKDASVLALFSHEGCKFLEKRNESGELSALLCYSGNVILLLCVDAPYRNRGWGSELLALAETEIGQSGCDEVTLGAGFSYLMPGVPTHTPQFVSASERTLSPAWEDFSAFFKKRGYLHAWFCNCFDMKKSLSRDGDLPQDGSLHFASLAEKDAVCRMVEEAHASFVKHYRNESLYHESSARRVLVFGEEDTVKGALILTSGEDGVGLVGCVAVHKAFRGRGIAKRLVRYGTDHLALRGAKIAFVGYTYSGMERLYGKCGYEISSYYFMGRKRLPNIE